MMVGGMNRVTDAGALREIAVLRLGGLGGAVFQDGEDVVARRFHLADIVDEREKGDDVAIGDGARRDVGADAAAVGQGDLRAGGMAHGVAEEVAGVGLAAADQAVAVSVIDPQVHFAVAEDAGGRFLHPGLDVGDNRNDSRIFFRNSLDRDELVRDVSVNVDDELADVLEGGAGLADQHGLAVLIVEILARNGRMGMAVEHGVDARRRGDKSMGIYILDDGLLAEMGQDDDEFRPLGTGLVGRFLHQPVDGFRLEIIGLFTRLVMERIELVIGRSRRQDADKGDLPGTILADDICRKHPLAGLDVEEVGADHRRVVLTGQLEQAVGVVVEFVVAERHGVVADCLLDVHDIGAEGESAGGAALEIVSG